MSAASTPLHNLARQLLDAESAGAEPTLGAAGPLVNACARLRGPLKKLVGTAGYSSLLSRALTVAARKAPALQSLRISADGSFANIDAVQPGAAPVEVLRNAGVVFLADLLGLLVAFIGQPLTLSLVREAWPDRCIENAMFEKKELL